MVNTDEFIERLEKILAHYQLSASAFADALGIQRSGVSHLLSGRNKPSLDFVLKLLHTYPEVDLQWLMNGKGEFPKSKQQSEDVFSESLPQKNTPTQTLPLQVNKPVTVNAQKSIKEIVVLYTDGTFESYKSV